MADASPPFALYVSSVEGRLVSRPGHPHDYIGAALRTPDEVKTSITDPLFFPEQITPVLATEYLRFVREWDKLIRNGDLKKRTAEDFAAYQAKQKAAEDRRDGELAKIARAEKAAAPAAQQGGA